jgi:hypothetical protein
MQTEKIIDFTQHDTNSAYSFSDYAEALNALQRVCGFSRNHNNIFLACIAAANEHGSNEFQATFAELGARLSSEVQPFKKNMDEAEQNRRRRALSEKFKRAYKNLETDQKATGLWFVTVKSGGIERGKKFNSLFRVNVSAITRTIEIARQRNDFTQHRVRCFEFAAEKVLDSMTRRYDEGIKTPYLRGAHSEESTFTKIKRYESMVKAYARKIYECGVREEFSADEFNKIKERLQQNIAYWFGVSFPAAFAIEKVHGSDPHTSIIKGTDSCTVGETTQDENFAPPVFLNSSSGVPMMNDRGGDESPLTDALRTLDLVRSIGAWRSNVILIEDTSKHKEVLATEATLDEVKEKFPVWLDRSERERKSLVVDLKPNGRHIIQVDEANAEVMQMLSPVSFMTIETSHDNGQVWLALPDSLSNDEIEDVKERLFIVLKDKGANKGASGGLRWVGTHNFKPERRAADGSFPRVRLLAFSAGRITNAAELESLGLLAEPQPKPLFKPKGDSARQSNKAKREPSYEHAIQVVRRKTNGDIDRSAVDFHYAVICLSWGFSESETIGLLNTHSEKVKERRDNYAEKVVADASRVARPAGM